MSNQVTGRVYIRVDGLLLNSMPDAKLTNYSGIQRNPVIGNDVHGYTEETVAPSIECKISHMGDTSLEALADAKDVTVTFECDTGTVYVLKNAWLEAPPDLTGKGGEVNLKYTGRKCEEVI